MLLECHLYALRLHALKNTIKKIFKVIIQASCSLEDLENDLQEYGSLRSIGCSIFFFSEHSIISNFEQHLDGFRLIYNSSSSIYEVIV